MKHYTNNTYLHGLPRLVLNKHILLVRGLRQHGDVVPLHRILHVGLHHGQEARLQRRRLHDPLVVVHYASLG